jgi:hypothetical protein
MAVTRLPTSVAFNLSIQPTLFCLQICRTPRTEQLQARQQGVSQLLESSGSARGASQPDDDSREQSVQTSIGEMVYVDGDKSNPVLRNPLNAAGKMFSKLVKFFTEKLGNFSGTVIREGNYSAEFSNALPKLNYHQLKLVG